MRWIIVSQVKSNRVVYFTDDPDYSPEASSDWTFFSHYVGSLPDGMTLRNCWRWRFNGMEFEDASPPAKSKPSALEVGRAALLELLNQRVSTLRRAHEPSCVGGAQTRELKLREAQAFESAPNADYPLLLAGAAARRMSVGDYAQIILRQHAAHRAFLVATESLREELAGEIRRAESTSELDRVRLRVSTEVAAERLEVAPKAVPVAKVEKPSALTKGEVAAERARLELQLRVQINGLRRPYTSAYLMDDEILRAKAQLARQVIAAGGAAPQGLDVSALISHAAARRMNLFSAAQDVLAEHSRLQQVLLMTEQMKEAVLARLVTSTSREGFSALQEAIAQLAITEGDLRQLTEPQKAAA